jgi:DNA (cytosine-5)-methyltransferase 1
VAHINSTRLENCLNTRKNEAHEETIEARARFTIIPSGVISRHEWKHKPLLGRGVYGVPDRMDRIKSLGNAVIPQQIYPIFKAIMDIERVTI